MKLVLKIFSFLGLALNIVPAVLVFNGLISFATYQLLMLIGTLLWFSTAPFWINREKKTGF